MVSGGIEKEIKLGKRFWNSHKHMIKVLWINSLKKGRALGRGEV